MDPNVAALALAVIGVVGTLASLVSIPYRVSGMRPEEAAEWRMRAKIHYIAAAVFSTFTLPMLGRLWLAVLLG